MQYVAFSKCTVTPEEQFEPSESANMHNSSRNKFEIRANIKIQIQTRGGKRQNKKIVTSIEHLIKKTDYF